jgi:chemotaxis response regulator CheB
MFQVVVQSAMRQLKSKLRLPAPPTQSTETGKKSEPKDKTGLILILAVGGGILLMAMFSNLPTN